MISGAIVADVHATDKRFRDKASGGMPTPVDKTPLTAGTVPG